MTMATLRNDTRLFFRYAAQSLRGQMQYKASFAIWSFAQFIGIGVEFIGTWALFHRFGALRGWTLGQIALLYGIVNIAFWIAEAFGRGFDLFANVVKAGDFDRILLRPRPTSLQVAGSEFQFLRIGRFVQGAMVLVWGAFHADVVWTLPRCLLIPFAITGGVGVFYGLLILQATLCFWTVESLEIMNTVTYGGIEAAQYPLTVYRPWLRRFFTYVVPLACMNYLPAAALFGPTGGNISLPAFVPWTAPLIGVVFLLVSLRVWRFGERRYRSTGS